MAASYTLTSSRFPNGTTVYANPVSGPSADTASGVVSGGQVTLTGLRELEDYIAHANVDGAHVEARFRSGGGEAGLDLNIRDYVGLDAGGTSDMRDLINTASAAASAVATAGGYPYVRIGGFGRGVYRVDNPLWIRDKVRFELDEARIVAGADFTGVGQTSGIFRAAEVSNAAVAQGTGTTTSTSYIITAVSQPTLWKVEDRITGTGIPANTKVAAVDVLNSKIELDAAATASGTVTLTKALTYYGNYRNAGIVGGELDPNGKAVGCNIRALWTEDFLLDGVTVLHNRKVGDETWAFCVGGHRMLAKNVRVLGGAKLFEDGFHYCHGNGLRLESPYIESGDDAIALGYEPTDASFAASPDPLRNVLVTDAQVRAMRAFALKLYVQSGATGRDWEVTDVSVQGLSGQSGVLRNGGIWMEDYNAGLSPANQIKRVKVSGVSLDIGSKAHDDFQAIGVRIGSCSDVDVDASIQMTEAEDAVSGHELSQVDNSEDISLRLRCPLMGLRAGLRVINSNRVTLHRSRIVKSATCAHIVRVQASHDLRILDNDFEGMTTATRAVQVTEGLAATVIMRGNTVRTGGTPAGYGVSVETAACSHLIFEGNDCTQCINGILDESKVRAMAYFLVRDNKAQADLSMTDAPFAVVANVRNRIDALAASATPAIISEAGSGVPSGSQGGLGTFYFDPADYAVPGQAAKLRLAAHVITNATAPACNFTFGLYPVSASAGGAASVSVTAGTIVTGSTAAVTAPALGTRSRTETADFDAPAAGWYALMVTLSADMAASSAAVVRAVLKARGL